MQLLPHGTQLLPPVNPARIPPQPGNRPQRKTASEQLIDHHRELLPTRLAQVRACDPAPVRLEYVL
jgi:hypothetical protein